MDMHEYGLELFARYRAAEMRAEAETQRRLRGMDPASTRPSVALGAALSWVERRLLGVRRLLTPRSSTRATRASDHQRAA